jgi:hypothetical protein
VKNEGGNMTVRELTEKTLKGPLAYPPGIRISDNDNRPAIEHILEGLAQKASSGDPAAARELREWLALQVEIKA